MMTRNERMARGLLEIKAELSESATVGELIRAWTAYLDEQDLVIPMNYDEMAREIIGALEKSKWENSGTFGWPLGFNVVAAKLKELFRIPEDLEAAVQGVLDSYRTYGDHGSVAGRYRDVVASITTAVAPFYQKPEVPEDLEAAVSEAVEKAKVDNPPDDEKKETGFHVGILRCAWYMHRATAPLLAERDRTLKMQHDSIVRMDKRVKGLERQHASIRLGIHDTLRRLERADSTTKWWADKNNIRNCLVGLQGAAAKESLR